METNDYICPSCKKKFSIPSDAQRIFCVYCGTELNKENINFKNENNIYAWLKEYILIKNPEERLSFLNRSASAFPDVVPQLKKLWDDRFVKSKTKDLAWADRWLGNFQILLTYKNEKVGRFQRKRISRLYEKWFLTESLMDSFGNSLPKLGEMAAVDDLWEKLTSPLYLLYIELMSLSYLYVSLCMTDKNYGSLLLGIGRRKDSNIAARLSDDLVDLQTNVLTPLSIEIPLNRLLIKVLHDGYRMYFDEKFELGS